MLRKIIILLTSAQFSPMHSVVDFGYLSVGVFTCIVWVLLKMAIDCSETEHLMKIVEGKLFFPVTAEIHLKIKSSFTAVLITIEPLL